MKIIRFVTLIILTSLFIACSNDDKVGSARIQVVLVDAPAAYDAVLIDIQDIQVNVSTDSSSGWQSLDGAQPGVYDLLLLTNGEEAFLGEIELPEGQLGQVRLILGSGNEVTVDGTTHVLTVPSGSQSGLKLNIHQEILAGITYKLVIDFDAAKSVVEAGNSGRFNLKPVIRAAFEAQSGAIEGIVSPAEIAAVVYAVRDDDGDTASTYPDETGAYLVRALKAGSYTLSAVPTETDTIAAAILQGIVVEAGVITSADTLNLID